MPEDLSIRNVPDDLVEKLRLRAAQSHRSLQGELIAILEAAVAGESRLTPMQVLARVRALGLETEDDATEIIRRARDGR